MSFCRVCSKSVTHGKSCVLCHMPICGDHRTHTGGGFSKKTYYCKPDCQFVDPSAPRPPPAGPYAPAQVVGYPSQYQTPHSASQPSNSSFGAGAQQGSYYPSPGGASTSSSAASPNGAGTGAGTGSGYYTPPTNRYAQPAPPPPQRPPSPQRAAPPQPYTSPTSYQSTSTPPPAAAPTQLVVPPELREITCVGDPLPTAPQPVDGKSTVRMTDGSLQDVLQDVGPINAMCHHLPKTCRRGDCVAFTVLNSYGTVLRKRGVVLGTTIAGDMAVLERRSVANGFSSEGIIVPRDRTPTVELLQLGRCRHCGCLIPLDESKVHVDKVHKTGSGSTTRVDEQLGLCVGNVDLLTSLKTEKKLGEGAQGVVYLATKPPHVVVDDPIVPSDATKFVLKEIACATPDESRARYQQAVRLMALKHAHVIRYLAVQQTPDTTRVRVVMPYYAEKDLMDTIRRANERVHENWILSIILQIAGALKYLHSHVPPILHGDIKPENIMMTNRMNQVILMDFDTAVEMSRQGVTRQFCGTTEWMAPEAANKGHASVASDVWSLGLIAYVLAVLPEFPMLSNERGEQILMNSDEWKPDDLKRAIGDAIRQRKYSEGFVKLVTRMLEFDERQRPAAATVEADTTDLMEQLLLGTA